MHYNNYKGKIVDHYIIDFSMVSDHALEQSNFPVNTAYTAYKFAGSSTSHSHTIFDLLGSHHCQASRSRDSIEREVFPILLHLTISGSPGPFDLELIALPCTPTRWRTHLENAPGANKTSITEHQS